MEVVVSAISAGIALIALVVSIVVARRQTAVQERLAAIEEARRAEEVAARGRAWVTAVIERPEHELSIVTKASASPTRPPVGYPPVVLVLRNEGPALARSVLVEIQQGSRPMGLEVLPVDLQPGQPMRFPIVRDLHDKTTMRIVVGWTDDDGNHQEPFTLLAI